jgi:hypothetical protein
MGKGKETQVSTRGKCIELSCLVASHFLWFLPSNPPSLSASHPFSHSSIPFPHPTPPSTPPPIRPYFAGCGTSLHLELLLPLPSLPFPISSPTRRSWSFRLTPDPRTPLTACPHPSISPRSVTGYATGLTHSSSSSNRAAASRWGGGQAEGSGGGGGGGGGTPPEQGYDMLLRSITCMLVDKSHAFNLQVQPGGWHAGAWLVVFTAGGQAGS